MSFSFQSLALKVTKDEEVASVRICPLITTFGIDDQADKSPSSSLFVFVSFSVCFSFVFVVYFSLYFDILFSLAFSFYLICLSFLVWLSLLIFSISCFVSIWFEKAYRVREWAYCFLKKLKEIKWIWMKL
jgi:hypothetical protein